MHKSPVSRAALFLLMVIMSMAAMPAYAQTAQEHLQKETKPVFAQEHTLPALARWGWSMATPVKIELADHWGYALEMPTITSKVVDGIIANPQGDLAKLVAMAKSQPEKYKLAIMTHRPLSGRLLAKTAASDPELAKLVEQIRVRDAEGNFPEGPAWKQWSPLAPPALFEWAAKETASPIERLRELAPIAIIMNGGEYGLSVPGHSKTLWEQDPRVVADKGDMSWYEYASMKKRDQELPITKAVQNVTPDRQLYLWYHFGGVPTWDGPAWSTDAKYTLELSDVPTQSLYFKHFNTGWTGNKDLLTNFMISVSQAVAMDQPLSYNWYCAGWGEREFSDEDRYYGFLKSTYAAGAIGGVAGYFSHPKGGFAADLGEESPSWLWQMEALGRVHALYSHVEDMLRNGHLLKGDRTGRRYGELASYEFETGDADARVIIRKHNDKPLWLASAWAATGDARKVMVSVPGLGDVELEARPAGSVYLLTAHEPIEHEPPVVTATLLDEDAMLPSQSVMEQMKKVKIQK